MRLGVFGGSFDPIHYGHLILAEQCREHAQLEQILFVPASISPLKTVAPLATDRQRVEMLSLALAGNTAFQISTAEIDRGGKSYTVDTLSQLSEEFMGNELYLLMGEDSLNSFDDWHQPDKICELAIPLVVRRPAAGGSTMAEVDLNPLKKHMNNTRFELARDHVFNSRLIDISSTEIRTRVQDGKSIRYLVTRAVEKFIETNNIYSPDS